MKSLFSGPAPRVFCLPPGVDFATDEDYHAGLSPSSRKTLDMQGGPFSKAEAEAFLKLPHARDAVRLRIWDDRGKEPNMVTPPVGHFFGYLTEVMKPGAAA